MTLATAQAIFNKLPRLGVHFSTLYAKYPAGTISGGDLPWLSVEQILDAGLEEQELVYYVDLPGGLIEPAQDLSYIATLMDGSLDGYRRMWAGFNPTNNPWGALPQLFNLTDKNGQPIVAQAVEEALRKLMA